MSAVRSLIAFLIFSGTLLLGCQNEPENLLPEEELEEVQKLYFYFGADLSNVNQVLDKGGTYRVGGYIENPYKIFADHGTNLARFRLWHSPDWTASVYGDSEKQLYNDLLDVEKALAASKDQGMQTLLDFHYSDIWADPGRQDIPATWMDITSLDVLQDSVYNYTYNTLSYLASKNLLPDFVQIGNETNCGMMYTNAPTNFPKLNVCEGNWANMRLIVNSAIRAVRDVSADEFIQIILHVADPKNVDWWFTNLMTTVSDFDIIGFSYYPIWHTEIGINQLGNQTAALKSKFGKEIMMLETAYPWTTESNDNYTNIFGNQTPLSDYPFTKTGQREILQKMTQELLDGGAMGIIYWEPAWISSGMRDLWGTGSAWENCTFFDFDNNLHEGILYSEHAFTN